MACFPAALARGGFVDLVVAAHDFGFPGDPGADGFATWCPDAMVLDWISGRGCERHMVGGALDVKVY